MNEIERKFYDAWMEQEDESMIQPGFVIGPYKADFLINENTVVEIDGHESHKTKEQRSKDYKRERFLQGEGYIVVRFTGTEVYLEAEKCVEEAVKISCLFSEKIIDAYEKGQESIA